MVVTGSRVWYGLGLDILKPSPTCIVGGKHLRRYNEFVASLELAGAVRKASVVVLLPLHLKLAPNLPPNLLLISVPILKITGPKF